MFAMSFSCVRSATLPRTVPSAATSVSELVIVNLVSFCAMLPMPRTTERPAEPASHSICMPPSGAAGMGKSPAGLPSGASSTILPGIICATAILFSGVTKSCDARRNSPGPSPSRPIARTKWPSLSNTLTVLS